MTDSPNPFRVVLRGYDPSQVDRLVSELVESGEAARRQVATLEDRVQQLEDELSRPVEDSPVEDRPAEPASFTHLGERVGQILALADDEANEMRERAREEAATHRTQVEEAAAAVRADADRYAEQRRSEVETEAARLLEDARRTADERLDVADRDAAARLQEAEAVHETQRAKSAKAAADFETTLAARRQKAEAEFTQQMAEADERLEKLQRHIEDSRAEAEAAQAEAARESRLLIDDASQQAATIVGDAKVMAARIRAESERELAAATQRRDSINAQLANVRQMLTTLTGVAPSALVDQVIGDADAQEDAAAVASTSEAGVSVPEQSRTEAGTEVETGQDTEDHGDGRDETADPRPEPESESDANAEDDDQEKVFTPYVPPRIG
jgi:cell division septum initiation protein DivIVA